jgi:hypothetical protein
MSKRPGSGKPVALVIDPFFALGTEDWTYDGHVHLAIVWDDRPNFDGTLNAWCRGSDGLIHTASVAKSAGVDWDEPDLDLGSVDGSGPIDCRWQVRDLRGELIRQGDMFEIV